MTDAKERLNYIRQQVALLKKSCEKESKEAFKETGGDAEDEVNFRKAMNKEKANKIPSALSSCIQRELSDTSGLDASEKSKKVRLANRKCNTEAQEAHALSGGDPKEYALQKSL